MGVYRNLLPMMWSGSSSFNQDMESLSEGSCFTRHSSCTVLPRATVWSSGARKILVGSEENQDVSAHFQEATAHREADHG